jgi:outer membrane protein assembly factor BamB
VTVTGSGFAHATGVRFGHVRVPFRVDSDTQVTASAPTGGTGRIRVRTRQGVWVSPLSFDVLQPGLSWPQSRFDSGQTGYNPAETVIGPGNVSQLQPAWSARTGAHVMSVTVAGGVAYVPAGNLVAFDAATGARLWQAPVDSWLYAAPAVEDGVVYTASLTGSIAAFDTATGAEQWNNPDPLDGEIYLPPTVANGLVYETSPYNGNLGAFDTTTGALRWRVTLPLLGTNTGRPVVANGDVYVNAGHFKLYALDAATGTLRWSTPDGNYYSEPTVAAGRVYIGTFASDSGRNTLYALDASSGNVVWQTDTGSDPVDSEAAVANGRIYVVTGRFHSELTAFDAASGASLWQHSITTSLVAPVVANGVVYIDTKGGTLSALDAQTGVLLWQHMSGGGGGLAATVIVNGTLYLGTERRLTAYRLP